MQGFEISCQTEASGPFISRAVGILLLVPLNVHFYIFLTLYFKYLQVFNLNFYCSYSLCTYRG